VQGVAAGLLIAGVVWLYRELGAWEDVEIAQQLARLESAQPNDVVALIDRIEHRAEARQGNTDYALLLAEYYLSGNDPGAALIYFERLIAVGAIAPEILGKAAQAEFLAADRELSAQARSRAEQALAMNPMQSAALATLGMAAFEEADYRGAITYWQKLRALEAPGSPGHTMLGQVIARAEQELAAAGGLMTAPAGPEPAAEGASADGAVSVEIALSTQATLADAARFDEELAALDAALASDVKKTLAKFDAKKRRVEADVAAARRAVHERGGVKSMLLELARNM